MDKQDLMTAFCKVCVNRYSAIDHAHGGGPMLYRRHDLYQWSKEAYERGEECFYCEPADPNDRFGYGKLRLCEPKYTYQLRRDLTPEEFELLFDLNKNNETKSMQDP